MSEVRLCHYVTTDDVITKCRHQSAEARVHLSQPTRNSAPSRLEHLDDFLQHGIEGHVTKSSSLVNLFHSYPPYRREPPGESIRGLDPDGMPHPSNFRVESDGSLPPTPPDLKQFQFFPELLSETRADHEDLEASDDYETISQTSSNSLEPCDHRCCFTSRPQGEKTRVPETNGFHGEKQTGIIDLEVPRVGPGRTDDDVTIDSSILRKCSTESIDSKLSPHDRNYDDDADDLESLSSISSDDTFVGEKVLDDKPPAVYRSLSDSTVQTIGKVFSKEPKRRKSVHFADNSGYELEIHIPISNTDDYLVPPKLMEALGKLRATDTSKDDSFFYTPPEQSGGRVPQHMLVLNFRQPFLEPTFRTRVDQQNVCLESISILPNSLSFTGVIRVTNIEFEKQVFVRYTPDMWITYIDVPANYISSLKDFHQDQFSFHVVASKTVLSSGRIELAVCYRLPRTKWEFWDNNYSRNYVLKCVEHYGTP